MRYKINIPLPVLIFFLHTYKKNVLNKQKYICFVGKVQIRFIDRSLRKDFLKRVYYSSLQSEKSLKCIRSFITMLLDLDIIQVITQF